MHVLGLLVKPSNPPTVVCVVLGGERGSPTLIDTFELVASEASSVDRIESLGRQLSSKMSSYELGACVVRSADFSNRGGRSAAAQLRMRIEGAIVYVCRCRIKTVRVRSGREIGDDLGVTKDKAEAMGRSIDAARASAAAAAISALPDGGLSETGLAEDLEII